MKRRQLLQRAATGLALVAGPQVIDMGSSSGSSQDATIPLDELLSVVSLSHVNDPATTPAFPGDPEFTLETAATIADDGYYLQTSRRVNTPAHIGARRRISRKVGSRPTNSIRRIFSSPR